MFLVVTLIIGCGDNSTPSTTAPVLTTKQVYSIVGIPSMSDTSFSQPQITVYATTFSIQAGTILYSDNGLTNPVTFAYFQVGGIVYKSPNVNGQFYIVSQGGVGNQQKYIK